MGALTWAALPSAGSGVGSRKRPHCLIPRPVVADPDEDQTSVRIGECAECFDNLALEAEALLELSSLTFSGTDPFSHGYGWQAVSRRLRDALPYRHLQSATVTRKKVAGIEVASLVGLLFCSWNRTSSSFCNSAARPSFSAASNAFMVGP